MLNIRGSADSRPGRYGRSLGAILLLPACLFLTAAPLQAQDWMSGMSPGSSPGSTVTQPPFPSMPYPDGATPSMPSPYDATPSMPSEFASPDLERAYDTWSPRPGRAPDADATRRPVEDYQPDLTGNWRGSGGETVEIQRNRARIWGGSHQSCSCVFFLVGQRMIAYSPDTDMVRKYWYRRESHDRFSLIDERGNPLSFWRVR